MSRMKDAVFDIEEFLREGHDPQWIADIVNVPIELVYQVEEDLMQLGNPYFYGPDSK